MQYILNEDEYQSLVNAKLARALYAEKKLQELCTRVCDSSPSKESDRAWGCMLSAAKLGNVWTCDQCPVIDYCPEEKKQWTEP